MSSFPVVWPLVSLMDVIDLHDSRRVPLNHTQRATRQGKYPYYGANGEVDSIDDYLFDGEFVLVAEDGGYFDDPTRAVAYEVSGRFWVNNHAHILSPKSALLRRYLTHALNNLNWMAYVGGSTRLKLTQEGMRRIRIPLPPIEEQRRIAARLDGFFSRSTAARSEVAHIPDLVARYKRAVINSAYRGELTANWRKQNASDVRPFLAQHGISILQQAPPGPLPSEWVWANAGSLCAIKSGVALGKKRPAGVQLVELPYLRVANVQRGWLNLETMKTIPVTPKEAEALLLHPGDILMNEGGDRDKLGRGWVWEGQIPRCIHQNHVFRLRPRTKDIPGTYISHYSNEFGQQYFVDEGKQTTNLASISMTKISALPVPVAPPNEMKVIVQRIEILFSRVDKLANDTSRVIQLLDRLEKAILENGFRDGPIPIDTRSRTRQKAAAE
jgi:type I restriction enzyme S subunit